ncbi:hypothetical protein [Mesorhizobium sp.]|uniref:hypothetical protein n=1 Tax=Mesorhizobium sp. TaxID=1871066 RepID=UPI000FE2FB9F|nr:hypothetical protein [Mesorhizobium sp.]RWN55127.1 MAG: hypothetical protein EOR98_13735 [Mesorhizobium sp.]RWN75943.1 MAG: hypothetical protein EOS02_15780 [Mesorhizobium sp.]RWN79693.1 MAG: hypothetical protein EOS01_13555 [Mesorhizobium sp.]RWN88362.1 MAG: hypothetical protein EOS04_12785 [Mesorhizobium sp.]RWO14301.1 MAG: hypothetical protein EOS15_15295 [Mesorhizobium sp.]
MFESHIDHLTPSVARISIGGLENLVNSALFLTAVSHGTKRPLGSMVGAANSGWTRRHGEFESLLKYHGLGLTAQESGMSASMRLS